MKATIKIEKSGQPHELFVKGNLVQSDENIILVTALMVGGCFSGVCVSAKDERYLLDHNTRWDCDNFKQFHGTITLNT